MNSNVTGQQHNRPSISEIFTDPYDPDKSFWVHSEIRKDLRSCFAEADRHLADGNFRLAKRPLETIVQQLPEAFRAPFFKRTTYNQIYLQPYEPRQQTIDLPAGLKEKFAKKFSESRAVLDKIDPPAAVRELLQRTRREMSELYGADIIRSSVSVRYANHLSPSPYKCDNTQDVPSQLLSAMHFDEKKGVTSIVYLTDVDEQSGCFSYLEGSNRIRQSVSIRALHETMMHDMNVKTIDDARKYGITDGLAGTIAYGENLPPAKKEVALRYIHKLVGPAGTAISFAGNILVHGGGWPLKGERIAMFINHVGLIRQRARYLVPYYLHFKLAA
jgi:hypothetical protein